MPYYKAGSAVLAPIYDGDETSTLVCDYGPAVVTKVYLPDPAFERQGPLVDVLYEDWAERGFLGRVSIESVLQIKLLPLNTPPEVLQVLRKHIQMWGDCPCGNMDALGLFGGLEEAENCLLLDRLAAI